MPSGMVPTTRRDMQADMRIEKLAVLGRENVTFTMLAVFPGEGGTGVD